MKRALAWTAASLTLLTLLVAALATYVMFTESGLRLVAARVADRLPAGSHLGELRGRLAGPLEVEGARIESSAATVVIGAGSLDWSPMALLSRELRFLRLELRDIDVQLHEASADRSPDPSRTGLAFPRLPLDVEIERSRLTRLQVHPPAALAPLLIDSITLAGRVDGEDGINLRELEAHGPRIEIVGQLALGTDQAVSSSLSWRYDLADFPPLRGMLDARGGEGRIELEHNLAAPYNLRLQGTLSDPFETPSWTGTLSSEGVDPSQIDASWPAARIAGQAALEASAQQLRGALALELEVPGQAPLDIRARLALEGKRLSLSELVLEPRDGRGRVRAQGVLSFSRGLDEPGFEITSQWTALELELSETLRLVGASGGGELRGTADAFRFTVDSELQLNDWPRGHWRIGGSGTAEALTLESVHAEVLGGRLRGAGGVSWKDVPALRFDLEAEAIDPAQLIEQLDGSLSFQTELRGRLDPAGADWTVVLRGLTGTLRSQPVRGGGAARWSAAGLALEELDLEVGKVRLEATGQVAQSSDLRWELDAPDLGTVLPGAAGRAHSTGRIEGTRENLRASAKLEATGLVLSDVTVAEANLALDVRASGAATSRLSLTARGIAVGGTGADGLDMQAEGTLDAHAGTLELVSGQGKVEASFQGAVIERAWNGQIDALAVSVQERGWTLRDPVTIRGGADEVELGQGCLQDPSSRLCGSGRWQRGEPWTAQIILETLPLQQLAVFMPPALAYAGELSGMLDLRGGAGGVTGEGTLSLTPGEVRQRDPELSLLAWGGAQASTRLTGEQVELEGRFDLEGEGFVEVALELPIAGARLREDRPISVRLAGRIADLPLLAALVPDISNLRGETRLDLQVAGTIAQPEFNGSVRLSGGSALLPRAGIGLTDTEIAITGAGRELSLSGTARSGDGTIAVEGEVSAASGEWRGSAQLTGEDFLAASLPELSATVTPTAQVVIEGRRLRVEGEIVIPTARIAPRDVSGAVQVSPDQVIIGAQEAATQDEGWELFSRVRLVVGEDVRFEGFGLKGQVQGSLLAVERPGKLATAAGELRVVDAEYTAYGTTLTVERGRLLFNSSPLDNPGLDIRAVRDLDAVKVGVDLRGTLRRPELSLFSEPPLSQSDTLAYLVIGRPVSGLQENEQTAVDNAAQSLGLGGANLLTKQVGRRIGLDEFGFKNTGDESQASFVIGKYLSPKLYVSYGLGLFETFNTLLVRYDITPKVSVQTQTGDESSADVFYIIEK